jgi:hypothetical protein
VPDDTPLPATGEPAIVLKVRAQFAKWAAVSGGLFLINVATGINSPWFLIPAAAMGIGMLQSYGKLWQAGYSWRDVLRRPPAPDAVETTMIKGGKLPRQLPLPRAADFGAQTATVLQAHGDRVAIYKLLDKLTPAEREMLPEVAQTVDALYERTADLARTLNVMDTSLDTDGLGQVEERIAAVSREPDDAERGRRLSLLEKQRQTLSDLKARRPASPRCWAISPRRRSRPRLSPATWTTRSRQPERSRRPCSSAGRAGHCDGRRRAPSSWRLVP